MIDDMVSRIKNIPPLPKSFHEVDLIYKSENGNVNSMAKAVAKDPMFVANLLKVANSPLYGFAKEISSILQAVSLFGMTTTRNLCLNISVKQLLNIDIEPYGLTAEKFGEIMNLQGALASLWCKKIQPEKKDFVFLSALMQEIGKIVIADQVAQNDEVVQFKSEILTSFNIDQAEKMYVDTSTPYVTTAIFKHWNLDETMVKAIEQSADPFKSDSLMKEALILFVIRKAIPVNSPLSDKSLSVAKHILEKTDLDSEIFMQCAEEIRQKNKIQ